MKIWFITNCVALVLWIITIIKHNDRYGEEGMSDSLAQGFGFLLVGGSWLIWGVTIIVKWLVAK